jgi:steroid 5-alpha reductase family enzyme
VLLLLSLAVILVFFTILWGVSVRLQNTTVADIGWGPGILLIGVVYFLTTDDASLRAGLTLALLAIWALRLSAHLAYRNRLLGEDYRHVVLRDAHDDTWWWKSYIAVFLPYALAAWVISLPIYFAIVSLAPRSLTLLDYLGVLMVVAGVAFETIGDEQLRQFRANRANKNRVLDSGVWKYSRHPNYFGEALLWWGFGVIGMATGGLPGLLGPAIMTYLLIYVTGVKPLEATLITKPGYIQYVGRTPPLLPIPAEVRMQLFKKRGKQARTAAPIRRRR